jgi:hypothetical protein
MAFPSFSVTFDNQTGSTNFGKIVLSCVHATAGITTRAWWEVTDPLGNVIKDIGTPYTSPDLTAVGITAATDTVSIPQNDDGDWIKGTYTIGIQYDITGATGYATMAITGFTDNAGDISASLTPDISAFPFDVQSPLLVEFNDGDSWEIATPSGDNFLVEGILPSPVPVRLTITSDDGFIYTLLYTLSWTSEEDVTLTLDSESVSVEERVMEDFTAYYCPNRTEDNSVSSIIDIDVSVNCVTGTITATDSTDNTGWTVDGDSVFSLVPPSTDGNPDPDDIAGTIGGAITGYIDWTFVTWQTVMNLIRSKTTASEVSNGTGTVDVTVVQAETLTTLINTQITCDSDLCDITACLAAKFNAVEAKANKVGGWSNVPPALIDSWARAQAAMDVYLAYVECGNFNKASTYLAIVKEELDCGCGCDDNTDTPKPYSPPASGAAAYSSILLEDGSAAKKITSLTALLGADVDSAADYMVIVDASAGVNKKILPDELAEALVSALTPLLEAALAFQPTLQYFAESQTGSSSVWTAAGSGTDRPAVMAPKGTGAFQLRSAGNARGANAIDLQTSASAVGQVASGDGSSVLGAANTASALNSHAKGNLAVAEHENEDAFGIGDAVLRRTTLTPYRKSQSGASAFLITIEGGATSDITLPAANSGNWSMGCLLTLFGTILNSGGGGFTAGDSFLFTRQFVIRSSGGTTQLEGSIEDIGTDIATASLSTTAVAITANNTLDTLEIEITPPAGMTGSNFMTVIGKLEILQLGLS